MEIGVKWGIVGVWAVVMVAEAVVVVTVVVVMVVMVVVVVVDHLDIVTWINGTRGDSWVKDIYLSNGCKVCVGWKEKI